MSKTVFVGAMVICAAALPTPSSAQSLQGPRVEVHFGYDHIDQDLPPAGRPSGDGVMYGVGAGYDFELGNVAIGPEVAADFASTRARGPSIGGLPYDARALRDLEASLRVGYKLGKRSLLYVKAGYTNARINFRSGTFRFSDTEDGIRVGAGFEQPLAGAAYVKVEYRFSHYPSIYDTDRHQVVGGVGLRF